MRKSRNREYLFILKRVVLNIHCIHLVFNRDGDQLSVVCIFTLSAFCKNDFSGVFRGGFLTGSDGAPDMNDGESNVPQVMEIIERSDE